MPADAITLDIKLPGLDGLTLLDRLKRSPTTRHIPVHVISVDEMRPPRRRAGRLCLPGKAGQPRGAGGRLRTITTFLDRPVRRLLLVEDDDRQRETIVELVGEGEDVEVTAVRTAEEAVDALEKDEFDCMVVDLILPGDDGFQPDGEGARQERLRELPVIVYTGKDLRRRTTRR